MFDPKYTDFINGFINIKNRLASPLIIFYLKFFSQIELGNAAKFNGMPIFLPRQGGSISIGKNFTANSNSNANPVGIYHRVIISALGKNAEVKIGNNVGLSGVSINSRKLKLSASSMKVFKPAPTVLKIKNPGINPKKLEKK